MANGKSGVCVARTDDSLDEVRPRTPTWSPPTNMANVQDHLALPEGWEKHRSKTQGLHYTQGEANTQNDAQGIQETESSLVACGEQVETKAKGSEGDEHGGGNSLVAAHAAPANKGRKEKEKTGKDKKQRKHERDPDADADEKVRRRKISKQNDPSTPVPSAPAAAAASSEGEATREFLEQSALAGAAASSEVEAALKLEQSASAAAAASSQTVKPADVVDIEAEETPNPLDIYNFGYTDELVLAYRKKKRHQRQRLF